MNSSNPFSDLADKAARGDTSAKSQLQRQLAPQMVHIVRRVIQERRDRSTLERRILAEADRVGLHAGLASKDERERLIRAVAQRLCSSVLARLRDDDEHLADETVRCSIGMSSRVID